MATLRLIGVSSTTQRQEEVLVELSSTINGSVGAGLSIYGDSIPLADLKSVKYEITLWTLTKSETMTMTVSYDSTGITDSVSGISGSRILKSVNSIIVGSDMKLDIINGELETINYKLEKK